MWLILWCLFGSVCLLSGYEAFSFGMITRAFPLALGSRKIEGRSAMACCVTLRPPAMQGAVEILKPDAVSSDMRSARTRTAVKRPSLFVTLHDELDPVGGELARKRGVLVLLLLTT